MPRKKRKEKNINEKHCINGQKEKSLIHKRYQHMHCTTILWKKSSMHGQKRKRKEKSLACRQR